MNHVHRAARLFLAPIILVTLFLCTNASWAGQDHSHTLSLTAKSSLLLDAGTGQILFEQNARMRLPPASTTKIVTALLALETGDLSQVVTVSPNAATVPEASLDLRPGEKITLEELIYGALLCSGNDACVAIAEHIAGTEANFVLLMNQKAWLLGADATSFKNTNGLPAAGHLTTALDLGILTRCALSNPTFRKIVNTREKTINGQEGLRGLSNTNRLLWSYNGANGVKTGTTDEAGNCLVASATKNGRQLISVVLNSENRWTDSQKLLDYGFNHFEFMNVVTAGDVYGTIGVVDGGGEAMAIASVDLGVVFPKDNPESIKKMVTLSSDLTAPLQKGQKVGCITILVQGEVAGSADLISDQELVKTSPYGSLWKWTSIFS